MNMLFERIPKEHESRRLASVKCILVSIIIGAAVFSNSSAASAGPVRIPSVILDTDMWGDVDDTMALAMLNALHDRHEIELVAVTSSTDDPAIPSFIDAVNRYYGHTGIPVGMARRGLRPEELIKKVPFLARLGEGYPANLILRKRPDGNQVFPHATASIAPDAISVLRKALSDQADGSVILISVGYKTNLAQLLDSRADAISPLPGRTLVAQKVKFLSVMGGTFGRATVLNQYVISPGDPEFNDKLDIDSARHVYAAWPTPIIASGQEVGATGFIRGVDIERLGLLNTPSPILEAYRFVDPVYRSNQTRAGELHDHASFDMTSVLYAARPNDGYFSLSERGDVTIQSDGRTRFVVTPHGKLRHIMWDHAQRARALEAITNLTTQPPLSNFTRK